MKRLLSLLLVTIAVLMPAKLWAADGEPEPYAVLSENNTVLTFYYDDQREARGGTLISQDGYPTWGSYEQVVESVVFDLAFANCTSITSTAYWFYECKNMTSISGIQYLNTANVTDMGDMFYNCSGLTSLDVSHFNTANVTNMFRMFSYCSGLTSLDLSNFNTANVTDMGDMFYYCSGLTSLDVSNFNTANVTNMRSMFYFCSGLTSLDVSSFNTSNVTDMASMFRYCSGLTSLDVSGFNTANVKYIFRMFGECNSLTSLDVSHFNTANVTNMDGMFHSCSGLTSLDVSNFNTANVTEMSGMFEGCSGLTSLDLSNFNTANVTSMSYMFYGCSGLTSLDLSNFNTANVTGMRSMFSRCSGLTSLDLSNFNTANVTDMVNMFLGCSGLTSLELNNFNTANVTSTHQMFAGCSSLTSLDLSSFNTANVTDMAEMFNNCNNLAILDLSGFNTVNVTSMQAMLNRCSSLKTIYVGENWTTVSVTKGDYMFLDCTNLIGGAGTVYDANHVAHTYAHIDGGTANPGYFTDKNATLAGNAEPYAVLSDNNTVLTFYYDDQRDVRGGMLINAAYARYDSLPWYNNRETIISAVFDASFANCNSITSTSYWFDDFSNLTAITGLNYLNTSNVTEMNNMFMGCSSLTSLDVTGFNTQNVTSMYRIFNGCSGVESLDVTGFNTQNMTDMAFMFTGCSGLKNLDVRGFNTQNVTNMAGMFAGCSGLTTLDLTGFNTEKVTDMSEMFNGCSNLTGLDLTSFNTQNVTRMHWMFYGCSSLASLKLSASTFETQKVATMHFMFYECSSLTNINTAGFNTQNVTNMHSMFNGCSSLKDLDLTGFNTEKVTNMGSLFSRCSSLTSLDVSNFYTANVTNMGGMFSECSGLTSLDLSNFATPSVTDMSYMFDRCSGLTTIYAGNEWNTSAVTSGYSMFRLCTNLKGGAGTTYDENHTDHTYAHIDGGTANPGYFTDKNATPSGNAEPYAVLSADNTVLTFYYNDQKESRGGMSVGPFTYEAARGWNAYVNEISTVVFDDTFANCTSITSTEKWFSGCLNLAVINGLNNLNTENVTTMNSMFADCRKLTTLDLSHFKTSNVTSMWAMFNNCLSLIELDMSNFNTENVNDTYAMFAGCSVLTTIYAGSEWKTSKMTADYSLNMFRDCLKLVGGAGTTYDANHIDYAYAHIDGGTANPGYFTDKNATPVASVEPYAVLSENNTVLTFYYDDQMTARNGMSVASSIGDAPSQPWSNHVNSITSVVFDASFANCTTLASTAYWFLDCRQLTTISGISNLNTANVTNMTLMFSDCSSLTSLDVSHFNTANVTEMSAMFQSCSGLTSLDLSNFNTANVTYMSGLFFDCSGLTNLDMSNFNTEKVVDMNRMFIGCSSLAAIQAGSAAIPDSIYAQIENPNLLVYVNNASLAPSSVQNVVVNGTAREIVLTDATTVNNNFYVPQAFTAERISYTRNFAQSTQVGVSRGWESIALPFDVQTITHETKGTIAPFGSSASSRHFWLRELGGNGLQNATSIKANTPYIISMPNSSDYTDNNNLAGRVTFAAENATIPVTEVKASAMADQSIVMIPTMQRQERSSEVWALNVGEVRGRYLEGSVFERDYREVRPFEAYTVHRQENTQPAPRYVPLQEIGGTTGIHSVESGELRTEKWYDLNGRQLQGKPSAKGVYINNGQKIVIR